MKQETRNKIYAAVAALFLVALSFGVVDQAQSDAALDALDRVLDLAPEVVGTITAALAWRKSLPSKVTVVEEPKAAVLAVTTATPTGSVTVAGPGSPQPDGTVLSRSHDLGQI